VRLLLFDTTVVSDYLKQKEPAASRIREYLEEHGQLALSILTWYEIDRWLRSTGASRQRRALDRLCRENQLLQVLPRFLDRAADIWVDLKKRGRSVDEVDIIIAATALTTGFGVATRDRDYEGITGLHVERWSLS